MLSIGKAARGKGGQGQARTSGYDRCTGTDAHRLQGGRQGAHTQVRADRLEAAVGADVCALLHHLQRLADEYHQRLAEMRRAQEQGDRATLETQIRAARQGMGRLIDSYAEGLMDKSPFELRITRLKARVAQLEAHRERLRDALGLRHDLQVVAGRLDECAARVRDHLDDVDWGGARCSSGPWSSAWISISRRSVWSFRHIVRGVVLRLFGTLLAEQNDE